MPKHHRAVGVVFFALCSAMAYGAELPASSAPAAETSSSVGASAASTPASPGAPGGLHFRITRYQIEGNTLIAADRLQTLVKPYTGEGHDFETIQQAVEAIYDAYNAAGYQTVRVIIPEQTLQDGVVKLQIVESKLKRIIVQGNRTHSERNILESLPDARIGSVPNSNKVGENLRLANENYSKQTQVTFRATETEGEAEGIARVVDKDAGRVAALLDNTGTQSTGKYRLGLVYQNANVMDWDHQLSLMYQTSPNHLKKVRILSGQYRMPIYDWGAIMELGAGYSNVDSGLISTAAGSYTVAGSGENYSWRFTKLLPRLGEWDQRLSLALDKRIFNNNVTFVGTTTSLVPGITLHPWSLSYQGSERGNGEEWNFGLNYIKNRPSGNSGDAAAFALPGQRIGANPSYSLWRYNVGYNGIITGEWQLRLNFNGQQTGDALVSGEQFGAGGMESVRGFNERELSNDKGMRSSLEIQTPALDRMGEGILSQTHIIWFADAARLSRNKPLPGEITSANISSTGLGLRMGLGKQGMAKLDAANVLRGADVRKRGSWMAHAGMSYLF